MLDFGFYKMDCMDGMKEFPDKYFDLAIVDPPYFSGPEKREYFGRKTSPIGVHRNFKKTDEWEVPTKEYFDELKRVSKNQIIWGCNYFDYKFGPGRIIWDKVNGASSFSDAEIAYTSVHDSVRLFRYMWNGMFQGKSISEGHLQKGNKRMNEVKIHPTQKPIDLYKWLVINYTKPSFKILDTHVGSASSLIAYHDAKLDFVGFEKDGQIFKDGKERLDIHKLQFQIDFNL